MKATLHPGVDVRKVASPTMGVQSDTRRVLDVCAVVKDGSTVVAQFVGIVEVVPKVQLPLSVRERALRGVRVEYTKSRGAFTFEITGETLSAGFALGGGVARGVWVGARAYASWLTDNRGDDGWLKMYFYPDKTAKYMFFSLDEANNVVETQIPTEAGILSGFSVHGNVGTWTGELPTGPVPW